jgi:NADH:ubiquinone oxidoreductase subunit H
MVFPLLGIGWVSECRYRVIGALRGAAQIVSYELRIALIIIRLGLIRHSLSFEGVVKVRNGMWNSLLVWPLRLIWFVIILAETRRRPYDFSEGERELVSGFNTEYGSGGFVLIFLAEYARILFISVVFVYFFISSNRINYIIGLKGGVLAALFV